MDAKKLCFADAASMDIKRENANINGDCAMGTMLRIGSEASKEMYLSEVIDKRFADAHRNGDIHIHDMDFYALTTTCTQIELRSLFKGGFCTGHGVLREPQDISSYSALACIAIQANQNDQHGGQSVVDFDYAMGDGVRKTFRKKYLENLRKAVSVYYGQTYGEEGLQGITETPTLVENPKLTRQLSDKGIKSSLLSFVQNEAEKDTIRATYQAMESLVHNLNTMNSRAGAQVPFSSINYGMDTSPEGRLAVEQVLLATEAGLGHGETPVFPIQIFRVKEGVNYNPGDPNYALFKLACRVSAKRLFPNFSFIDAPFNLQYYKEGHPETEVGYMGCFERHAVVTCRYEGKIYVESFEHLFERFRAIMGAPKIDGRTEYFLPKGLEIFDSSINGFTRVNVLLRNKDVHGWKRVKYEGSRVILCTDDHPLPIRGHGRKLVKDIRFGEWAPVAWHTPFEGDGTPVDIDAMWELYRNEISRIPNEVFTAPREQRLEFFGRLFDEQGKFECKTRGRVSSCWFNNTNRELINQILILVTSLGYATKEFNMMCLGRKDHTVLLCEIPENFEKYLHDDYNIARLKTLTPRRYRRHSHYGLDIEDAPELEGEYSYDVETASDRFDCDGISSHNCRTRVMGNVYDKNNAVAPRRGNLSFTSINLPRLAIEAHGSLQSFYGGLDAMLELTAAQLKERFDIVAKKKVKNMPFLMGEGVWMDSEKLGEGDEIGEVLKHGTLSIGFIGLAEALVALVGKHHGECERSQEIGLAIVRRIREFCDKRSQETGMNYTCLATPAEGLSGRFVKLDAEKYGVIKGVTDREYYTNSFHVPVYYPITAVKKLAVEGAYHALTNAGHISYVELDGDPTRNLEAFEKVVRCMHDSGIGYGAINHPVDRDPICGYIGIVNDVCPHCGRHESPDQPFERLRRITG